MALSNPARSEWVNIKTELENLEPGRGDEAFMALLELKFTDPVQRQRFLDWSVRKDAFALMIEEASPRGPPLDPVSYGAGLKAVDWSSIDSIRCWHDSLYEFKKGSGAKPIYLGREKHILYYLKPRNISLFERQLDFDRANTTKQHKYASTMLNADGTEAPFKYGCCLGELKYQHEFTESTTHSLTPFEDIPFLVYLDVCGLGIWIVLNEEDQDDLGDPVLMDPEADAWEYLPSPQNGRGSFRVMKIAELDGLFSVDRRHSFFPVLTRENTSQPLLNAWVTYPTAVRDAVISSRSS